jgi:hypothetical protein
MHWGFDGIAMFVVEGTRARQDLIKRRVVDHTIHFMR